MNDELTVEELRETLALRNRQIDAVHRISQALSSRGDLDSLLRETLTVALEIVDADAGSILLYDTAKRCLVFRYVVGPAAWLTGTGLDPDEEGKATAVFRTGQSAITNDTSIDPHNASIDLETGYRTQSILTVPLMIRGGRPIGVMQALNRRIGDFGPADRDLIEIIGSLAATAIVNAWLAEEAKLAAVARAVGDLSHDIKNHLTPVQTTVETTVTSFIEPMYEDLDRLVAANAERDPIVCREINSATLPLRDWYPEMQEAVEDGCADIWEMVSEISDYVKGTQSTNLQVGSICGVIEERLKRLRVLAAARRVTLSIEDDGVVPDFAFDRRLVGRAVYNLVNNALNAISEAVRRREIGLRQFNVKVGVRSQPEGEFPEGGFCLIEVEDDGPGIPPDVKETLFTPMVRSTTPGGTGIGTRFVKSVADAHGGRVGVRSELGQGATFWLKLPLKPNPINAGT
jgi:signal transduction histidine kinase